MQHLAVERIKYIIAVVLYGTIGLFLRMVSVPSEVVVLLNNRGIELDWNLRSVIFILILGLVHTGIAYCLYFSGMTTLSVQTVAVLGYLEPVVSVLCSVFILREHMGVCGWIGTVLIITAAVCSETIGDSPVGN